MRKNVKRMISVMAAIVLSISSMGTAAMAGAMDPSNLSIVEEADQNEEFAVQTEETNPNEEFAAQAGVADLTYKEVYNTMIGLKGKYPEGMTWTNFEPYGSKGNLGSTYEWKGGPVKGATCGVGCAAFVFLLSDAAFGDLPSRTLDNGRFTFEDVKVGDILRVNNHFVIVLQKSAAGVTVAEGNYNKSVHWGRVMSKAEVMVSSFLVTRYPENFVSADEPTANEVFQSGTQDNLSWTLTNAGTLTISGSGEISNFSEASKPSWMDYNDKIHTIVIENGITSIGAYAFYQNKALDIYIPDGVTNIGDYAFSGSGIIAATIPGTVKTIGNSAFRMCANITSVSVSEGAEVIGEEAFRGCTSLQYIDFPASITSIGAGAFMSCENMARVRFMPRSEMVEIGDNLFSQCWNLMDVTLPKTIDRISAGMFASCSSLPVLYIPASVKEIGENPFTSCKALKTINFGGSEAEWNKMVMPALQGSLTSTGTTVNYGVEFVDPFAKDPNDPGDFHPDGSGPTEHTHAWSTAWKNDSSYHWHDCTAENCTVTDNSQKDGYGPHSYGGWVMDRVPTTAQTGSRHKDCTVCLYRYTETIPMIVHTHSWASGWSKNETSHWHNCMASGCTIINNSQKSGYGQHSYGEWVTDQEATANEEGSRHKDCTVCLYRYTETIPVISHQHIWSEDWSEDDENYHWHYCMAEGCPLTDNSQKDGYEEHSYGDWIVDQEATANEEGSQHRECAVCKRRQTETISATGHPSATEHTHEWSEDWNKDDENYHWHYCMAEGCSLTDNSQKGGYEKHSYGDWIVDEKATANKAGSQHRECAVCGRHQIEVIEAIPVIKHTHAWSKKWSYNSSNHWRNCTAAGCTITKDSQKRGYGTHSYDSWVTDKAATATKGGSKHRDCTVCGYRQRGTIKATGSSIKTQLNTQLKKQLNAQLNTQLKPKLKKQLNTKLKSQLKPKLKKQLKAKLGTQSKAKLKKQLRTKLKPQLRTNIKKQLNAKLKPQLKASLKKQKKQLKADLKKQFGKQLGGQFNSVFETQYNKQFSSLFKTQYNKQFSSLFETQYNKQFNSLFKQLTK